MPRVALERDIKFFQSISRELVEAVIETPVVLYKLIIGDTKTNLYGESLNKTYYQGVQTTAVIERDDTSVSYEGFGPDKQQAVEFRFNRQRCRETSFAVPKVRDVNGTLVPTEAIQNLTVGYPEIGDVVLFDGIYYELDNVRQSALIGGQPQIYNKETNTFEDSRNQLIGVGFMVRRSQIQIDDRIYS